MKFKYIKCISDYLKETENENSNNRCFVLDVDDMSPKFVSLKM